MTTIALSAICAFFTAVTVFVNPGPAVTTTTPGTLLSRLAASAANAALASLRVSMTRTPAASHPVRMGDMCPPASVNIWKGENVVVRQKHVTF